MSPLSVSAVPPASCAIDTHAHVFERGLPLARVRRYVPDYDATVADYIQRLDQAGLTHGVLVQPSFLGSDNRYLMAALQAHPQRLRGIAMIDVDVSEEQLQQLAQAGVVGIRFNLVGGAELPDFACPAWQRVLAGVAQRGWQVEIHREARDLALILPVLLASGVRVVVDHFGRPDPLQGIDDAGFRYLLSVGHTRQVWVKLSASYRNGGVALGNQIAAAATPLLMQAYGLEQLLWGSDWPHTQHEQLTDYGQEFDRFARLLPDAREREVLNRAAARLFQY
jgi:predicted TIM-barrel fold metal-dependent hydrolase